MHHDQDGLAVLASFGGEPVHALAWAQPLLAQGPVLVYSSAEAQAIKAVQEQLGATGADRSLLQAKLLQPAG